MADYTEKLRQDLLEQFKEKPVIDALICAVGEQLTDLHRFFTALRDERGVLTAIGKQLDGVGDIVCLSREEAGAQACTAESVYVLDDEQYRDYLIFKIWKNTNNCTYHDIIKALRMFWDKPLYYHEDPKQPATMILDTGDITVDVDVSPLFKVPILKAAGVAVKIILHIVCRTSPVLHIGGRAGTVARLGLPPATDSYALCHTLRAGGRGGMQSSLGIREDTAPPPSTTILRTGGVCTILSNLSKGE